MLVYVAGPFFNATQLSWLERAEDILTRVGRAEIWSPRKRSYCPPDAPPQVRQRSFQDNREGLFRADFVLAVLDYLLPHGQELRVVEPAFPGAGGCRAVTKAIRQPDLGTVWEMGYANAAGRPIVGLFAEPPQTLNLMLAEALRGYLIGLGDLFSWAETLAQDGGPDYGSLRQHTGRII